MQMQNNPYLQTEAETLSPGQLLLKAYEDLISSINMAKEAIKNGDIAEKAKYISKADKTISILQAALDFEAGGEIAQNLDYLYKAIKHQLLLANANNSIENLDNALEILTPLYEAWQEVVKKEEGAGNLEEGV